MKVKHGRREFLMSLGAAAIAAPFLLRSQRAEAATVTKRLVLMAAANGPAYGRFINPTTGAISDGHGENTATNMLAYQTQYASWAATKSSIIMGVNNFAALLNNDGQHGPGFRTLYTGSRVYSDASSNEHIGGVSLDQYVGNKFGGKVPVWRVGVANGGELWSTGLAAPQPTQTNATTMWASHFKGVTAGAGSSAAQQAAVIAAQSSVFNGVMGELNALKCQLGASGQQAFDSHLAAISQMESSLSAATAVCMPPQSPTATGTNDGTFPVALAKAHMDMIVAAFACGLTQVATYQFGSPADGQRYAAAVGDSSMGGDQHHVIVHGIAGLSPNQQNQFVLEVGKFTIDQWAYLCNALDQVQEANGTMLTNSAVVLGWEQANPGSHLYRDATYFVGGNAGGYLKHGTGGSSASSLLPIDYYKLQPQLNAKVASTLGGKKESDGSVVTAGIAHNDLLTTLANSMGVATAAFGEAGLNVGELAELKA